MKELSDIPKEREYIGYLWMSDCECPLEFHNPTVLEKELSIDNNVNPFIVEGQLYCKEGDIEMSYSIKYVDNNYFVTEYDLNMIRQNYVLDDMKLIKTFIPNRIQASKIKFAQYWKEEPDVLCEGMPVLVPGPFVFVGFEYIKNKEGNNYDKSSI